MEQAYLLKGILKHFYDFFGHKISARESNMYFSKGVEIDLCVQIRNFLGFKEFLIMEYTLGCPSFMIGF